MTASFNFAEGKPVKAIVHDVSSPDVKAVREYVGMTQAEFASAFGISLEKRSAIGSVETADHAARRGFC